MDQTNSSHDQYFLSGPHFRSSLPSVKLEIRRGRARNLVRPIKSPVYLIGSARDCDLVLGDPQFPEVHAYLFVSETGVSLRHLGDGPEITINGTSIRNAPLEHGQRIRTGPYEFHMDIQWRPGDPTGRPPWEERQGSILAEHPLEGDTIAQIERLLLKINETHGDFPSPLRLYTGPTENDGPADCSDIRPTRRRERA